LKPSKYDFDVFSLWRIHMVFMQIVSNTRLTELPAWESARQVQRFGARNKFAERTYQLAILNHRRPWNPFCVVLQVLACFCRVWKSRINGRHALRPSCWTALANHMHAGVHMELLLFR
jgi:hypothetical protein